MGLFDSPSSFFNTIGDGITGLFGEIKNIGRDVFETGKSIIRAPTDLVKTVVDRGADIAKTVSHDVKETVTNASANIGGAVQGIGQSFAWPIAIAGAGLGALYLLKNK
jgi:phage-related protein